MSTLLATPLKLIGWATVGVGLAVGWKLGGLLYDMATDPETRDRLFEACGCTAEEHGQPLWKRKYTKISEE